MCTFYRISVGVGEIWKQSWTDFLYIRNLEMIREITTTKNAPVSVCACVNVATTWTCWTPLPWPCSLVCTCWPLFYCSVIGNGFVWLCFFWSGAPVDLPSLSNGFHAWVAVMLSLTSINTAVWFDQYLYYGLCTSHVSLQSSLLNPQCQKDITIVGAM